MKSIARKGRTDGRTDRKSTRQRPRVYGKNHGATNGTTYGTINRKAYGTTIETQNAPVRITAPPYVLGTKKILDVRV